MRACARETTSSFNVCTIKTKKSEGTKNTWGFEENWPLPCPKIVCYCGDYLSRGCAALSASWRSHVSVNQASQEQVRVYTFLQAARPAPASHFRVFSAVKTPSHWHSDSDEPAEQQWNHLMERHGNSRHLAGVHPPPPPLGLWNIFPSGLSENPCEQIMVARQSK